MNRLSRSTLQRIAGFRYKLTKDGERMPDDASLDASAAKVIDEANRIIKTKSKDVLTGAVDRVSKFRPKKGL